MATGAVIARILTQYSDKGSKAAQKDIARLTKKFDDFGRRAKKSFGIAIAATATLAIKIGKDAVEAAIEDSKSQAQLALAMKNTTGATQEAIAAAEAYIEKTMFRTNTADEQLRASLSTLYIATGDLTEAQRLQTIALDIAASQGKDLATVTVAITKAQQGNLTALKRLSPELSGLITKGMKAEEAFALLGLTYAGSAEALANLDPLTNLKLQYGEVLETLGYELLPVIKEFAKILESDVIPIIKDWIEANGDKLRQGLADVINLSMGLLDAIMQVAGFLQSNKELIKFAFNFFVLGRAIKVVGKGMSLIDKLVGGVIALFKGGRKEVAKLSDKFFDFIKTTESGYFGRFVELLGKAVSYVSQLVTGFLGLGAAWIAGKNALKAILGLEEDRAKLIDTTTKKTYNQMRVEQIASAAEKERARLRAAAEKAAAAAAAKAAAEAAKQAKYDAAVQSKILSIRKQLKITKDSAIDKETDLINLAAAEALLKKQGVIAKEEIAKLDRLKEENFLLGVRETLAKRYLDIQEKIADGVIDTKDLQDLAKRWGISIESAEMYIHLVDSINDGTISTAEIEKLAQMWGSSNEQAKAFLETYLRIHDGLLDEKEVFDLLKQGWATTEDEVKIYADLVAIVHDGIAKDADFQKLADKWDLSKEKVNQYVASMGAKFDYQGVFLDPVIALETKWKNATKALEDYLAMLGKGFKFGDTTKTPIVPGSGEDPAVIAAAKAAADAAAAAAADAAAALAESEAALAAIAAAESAASARSYAIAKALGDQEGMMLAAAGVNPSALASQESGAIGAASIAAQLAAAEQALQNERIMSTYASFKAKEALDLAASQSASTSMDYDERFRFNRGTVATAQGISGGNLMAAPVVNITVQGSVTAEEDLVQVVRNGLLATQYNGNSINLQAV